MTKFILSTTTVKVRLVTTFVLFVKIISAGEIHNDRLSGAAVSRLIEDYIKPFVRRFQIDTHPEPGDAIEDSAIEKAIEQKIKELKPRLDENTHTPDNNLQDKEDTIILESIDENRKIIHEAKQGPLKGHIHKYKKLRRKIEKVLKTEEVSDKTKALVTETLDQMIAQMLSSQCTWNRAEENKVFRSHSLQSDNSAMINSWESKWQELIQKYSAASKTTDAEGLGYKEMLLFLIRLREFFFEIHNELNARNDRYKVKCKVVDAELPKKFSVVNQRDVLRESPDEVVGSDDNCRNIRICSEELKSFLLDFYINLKETVDVALKNYEEMYKRDVNTANSWEKRSFVAIIRDISNELNEKVGKSFKRGTEKLKLDAHNSTEAKVEAIKIFLRSTVELVQKTIGNVLRVQLKPLDSQLRLTVRQDLITTLGIELSNLNKHFSDKICLIFQTCNGNASRRGNGALKRGRVDRNNIHMKLQLKFEDPVFRRSGSDIRVLSDEKRDQGYNRYLSPSTMKSVKAKFDARRYLNVSVTRTTYRIPVGRVKRTSVRKTTQRTTKCTTKSKTMKQTPTTAKTEKATTTAKTTLPSPKATTVMISSSTYTYRDYVKKMIAAGKLKNPTTTQEPVESTPAVMRLIGSFLY